MASRSSGGLVFPNATDKFTSDTEATSGIATSSFGTVKIGTTNTNGNRFPNWYMFDENPGTVNDDFGGAITGPIALNFSVAQRFTSIGLTIAFVNSPTNTFTVQAHNGTSWVSIATISNLSAGAEQVFALSTATNYNDYRVLTTIYCQLSRMRFFV
jgi:hypothetical protein